MILVIGLACSRRGRGSVVRVEGESEAITRS
jgi:hypothetical protein